MFGATLNFATTMSVKPAACSSFDPPASILSFSPDDTQVVVYFGVSGATAGGSPKVEFYDPSGGIIRTSSFAAVTSAGAFCFSSTVPIAGNAGASAVGMYTVKGYWDDSPIFTINYWVQNPGLTTEQKIFDFQALASIYAKRYAPYNWKRAAFNYDPLNLQPWLDRVSNTADDVEYLDTLVQYVAALKDTHSSYRAVSDWYADLGLGLDVYYGDSGEDFSVLIESISRTRLPAAQYPFAIGDEIVSIDGVKAADLLDEYRKYVSAASADSANHFASSYLTARSQSALPKAHRVGATATIVVKRRATGETETYDLPWTTSGTALTRIGSVSTPRVARPNVAAAADSDADAPYLRTLKSFRRELVESVPEYLGVGRLTPVWTVPDNFQVRAGLRPTDYFYTGVFSVNGHSIGYLRIPTFSLTSTAPALRQLDSEIEYLQANTEGLVVDVMRNPGGDPCYGETVMSRLIPTDWQAMARLVRPVWSDIADFQYELVLASYFGASKEEKDLLQSWTNDLLKTYQTGELLSRPLSLCSTSGLGRSSAGSVYSKPMLLLVDELSMSAADSFSAQFQDNGRGRLFGWRTNGAGGTVISLPAGFYSEMGTARVVRAMQYRPNAMQVSGFPETHFTENVGVQPDDSFRYNTVTNFLAGGKPFVDAFLAAIVADVESKKPATDPVR